MLIECIFFPLKKKKREKNTQSQSNYFMNCIQNQYITNQYQRVAEMVFGSKLNWPILFSSGVSILF